MRTVMMGMMLITAKTMKMNMKKKNMIMEIMDHNDLDCQNYAEEDAGCAWG